MSKKLSISAQQLVQEARAEIEEIAAAEALQLVQQDNIVFVDIRDIRERKRDGFIPGSFHCPRGMAEFWVDPDSPYYKDIFSRDAKFIFYCVSGWRSALTAYTLQKMGFDKAAHMKDGMLAWQDLGGQIEKPEK